jgi:hypothetical protein
MSINHKRLISFSLAIVIPQLLGGPNFSRPPFTSTVCRLLPLAVSLLCWRRSHAVITTYAATFSLWQLAPRQSLHAITLHRVLLAESIAELLSLSLLHFHGFLPHGVLPLIFAHAEARSTHQPPRCFHLSRLSQHLLLLSTFHTVNPLL